VYLHVELRIQILNCRLLGVPWLADGAQVRASHHEGHEAPPVVGRLEHELVTVQEARQVLLVAEILC